MGETYRLKSGTHRRTDDDGNPEVFGAGDVFEPTEQELEAFGDRFERVEPEGDGWMPVRGGTAAERDIQEGGEYRLVNGSHRVTDDDGTAVVLEEGDVAELSAEEVVAFGDKFEPVGAGESDEADSGTGDDGADSDTGDVEADSDTGAEVEEIDADAEPEAEADTDADTDSAGEVGGLIVDLSEIDRGELPEDFPATLPGDYRTLQSLAKANEIDARQSKADIIAALEATRDRNGDE